jgi:hypothetical protein
MKGKPLKRMWNVGDPVNIGQVINMKTEWTLGTIQVIFPLTVLLPDGKTLVRGEDEFLIKKPEPGTEAPDKIETPLDPKVLKQALVNIIKEGDTQSPNSTVKRMVNIAKEALGELTV